MAVAIAEALIAEGVEAFFAYVIAYFSTAFLISGAANALTKKPMQGSSFDSLGRTNTVRQAIAPWDIVIGRARKGGVITFIHQSDDKKELHLVITLAGHVSEEIEEVWVDDARMILDSSGFDTDRYGKSVRFNSVVPGSPYQITVPAIVALGEVDGPIESFIDPETELLRYRAGRMTDVSPASPSAIYEYNRVGNLFTFHPDAQVSITNVGISVYYTKSHVRVLKSLGAEAGQPFPDLVSESGGKWSNSHWQKGHTKIYVRLTSSPDLFPTGVPNITAVVRGAKMFDPRSGTTVWNPNPALTISHYLTQATYGLGADYATEIDAADLTAAANACEERVSLATATTGFTADPATDAIALTAGAKMPDTGDGVRVSSTTTLPAGLSAATTYYAIRTFGLLKLATSYANAIAGTAINITSAGSGTHTLTYWDEPRYRVNGVFNLAEKPQDVISRLLAAMAGKMVMFGDKWHIQAGVYYAPNFTLDEGDMRSAVQSQTLLPRTQNANAVKGVFTDPNNNWQPSGGPSIVSASYLAEDGERIWADVDYTAFVTSGTQFQRLAKIVLLRTRQSQTFSASFSLAAWRARCGMTVGITNAKRGWSSKAFDVLSSKFTILPDQALGIDIVGRETAAAIFDWSTSEEQPVDIAPNTNFPEPFFIAAPGAPQVAEVLYETTGSAGLKSRATLSVGVVEQARYYRFAFRLQGDLDYIILPDRNEPFVVIDDIAAGTYDFKCAAVNFFASQSDYSTVTEKAIVGLTAPPEDATGFSVIASNGFAVARWDLSPDLDVNIGGRAIVRHSPMTSGATWEDGVLISGTADLPGFPGDTIMSPPMSLKTGTYLLKFRDSSGNYSVTAASFVATEGMVTGFTTLTTVQEDSAFTGTKTNVVLNGSSIQLDTSGGAVLATGSYAFAGPYTDLGSVAIRRFEATIDALSFDLGSLIDAILDPIDEWDSIDSGSVNDCNVILSARTTNDDPAGSPTWGAWTPFLVSDFNCRAAQFKLDFTSGNQNHNISVAQLRVAIKKADVASLASPTFTGTPASPTASVDTNTTQLATTAFVLGQAASATPLMDGAGAVGTSTRYGRGDHVHPSDTSRMPLAPSFESSEQTIPAVNTNVTVAHGLGRLPKLYRCVIRCKTTDFGYAVGDEIFLAGVYDGDGARNSTVWADGTNLGFRCSVSPNMVVADRSSTGAQVITTGSWKLVFYAW